MRSFETGLGEIAADRQSGSRAITNRVIELLLGVAWPPAVPAEYFIRKARSLLFAFPDFALIHDLLHCTGATLFDPPADRPVEAVRLCQAIDRWRTDWQSAQQRTTSHAAARIPAGATLVTLSNSSSVGALCRELARRGASPRVVVGESDPGGEGRVFADALRRMALEVALVPDAELPERARTAEVVVLGADAVFADRFVNKVGSADLARHARACGRPLWVVAETAKWTPAGRAVRPPEAAGNAAIFESVPGRLVDRLISELGALPFASAAAQLDKKPVFSPLLGA